MDPQVGNFTKGDVLIEGKKILAVGPNARIELVLAERIDQAIGLRYRHVVAPVSWVGGPTWTPLTSPTAPRRPT